jgi:hypothetical protein
MGRIAGGLYAATVTPQAGIVCTVGEPFDPTRYEAFCGNLQ